MSLKSDKLQVETTLYTYLVSNFDAIIDKHCLENDTVFFMCSSFSSTLLYDSCEHVILI